MDLFDVTIGQAYPCNDKPRAATDTERTAYLRWLASHRGIDASGCTFGSDGIWRGKVCILAMPGYGQPQTVTMDALDESGEVIRTSTIGLKNGKLGLDKAAVAAVAGKVAKPRGRPRKAVAAIPAPVAPEPVTVAPVEAPAAISARFKVTGAGRMQARRLRIIRAYLAMRAKRDLDRRALAITVAENASLRSRLDNALKAFADANAAVQTAQVERNAAIARADASQASVAGYRAENATLLAERDAAVANVAEQPFRREQVLAANLRIAQLQRHVETAERRLAMRIVPIPMNRKAA